MAETWIASSNLGFPFCRAPRRSGTMASDAEPYKPPPTFRGLEDLRDSVAELSENKELWLLQIPPGLELQDISGLQWSMRTNMSDGYIGHLYSSDGRRYEVLKRKMDGPIKYAYFPSNKSATGFQEVPWQVILAVDPEKPLKEVEEVEDSTPIGGVLDQANVESSQRSEKTSSKSVSGISMHSERSHQSPAGKTPQSKTMSSGISGQSDRSHHSPFKRKTLSTPLEKDKDSVEVKQKKSKSRTNDKV